MIEVVSLFREQDTRDELGIGSIRDALADFFFPGTTTLQTRARYFLLVPWMYTYYENRKVSSEKIAGRLRQDEIRLIDTLKEAGETGVIGERSGISLHRFPSSIYWKGLQRWGVCRFLGTTEQYHRSLDRWYEGNRQSSQADDYFSPGQIYNWDPDLPVRPAEDSGHRSQVSTGMPSFELYRESHHRSGREYRSRGRYCNFPLVASSDGYVPP